MKHEKNGFTIPELVVSMVVLITFALAIMGLYIVLINTANTARIKSISLGAATEQLEYLKSLPYDQLAIQGGSINSSGTKLPASKDVVKNGYNFTVYTSIQYADDAFDGCLSYPSAQSYLCRNGPAQTGSPVDPNPRDYKLIDIVIEERGAAKELEHLSTQVSARVAETGGNSGAILVTVIDSTGQPVSGASVNITNTTLGSPFSQTTTSDTNGAAIFLDVTPDNGKDYVISASKSGYSTLTTIAASGSLTPTYPNVSVLSQQVTYSTLKIDEISESSLKITLVSTSGTPVPSGSFSIKGGTKLYTSASNTSYSFNQNSLTTNSSGEYTFSNLVPGPYYVCFINDTCSSGWLLAATNTTYGSDSMQPILVPAGSESASGIGPMQSANLVVTTNTLYPRVKTITPASVLLTSSGIATSQITITGANLASATVTLRQGSTILPSIVLGSDSSTSIRRQINLSSRPGAWEVVIQSGANSIVQNGLSPGNIGGINVNP